MCLRDWTHFVPFRWLLPRKNPLLPTTWSTTLSTRTVLNSFSLCTTAWQTPSCWSLVPEWKLKTTISASTAPSGRGAQRQSLLLGPHLKLLSQWPSQSSTVALLPMHQFCLCLVWPQALTKVRLWAKPSDVGYVWRNVQPLPEFSRNAKLQSL